MKVKIDADELYPFYNFYEDAPLYGLEVDVPDTTLAHWRNVMEDFYAVQDQMRSYARRSYARGES